MTGDQIRSLQPALAALLERFRPCFKKEQTFKHWERYLLGLMADLKRKSHALSREGIEPIALAAGVAVRTLQEFLAFFDWDEQRVNRLLQQLVMDEHACDGAIGVLDGSGHAKQGDKTPGVQRQFLRCARGQGCGETGKVDNCVVGQHLLYTDNHPANPFNCVLAGDLYLPKSWDEDRERCRMAKIPDEVTYRPKWQIALDQVAEAQRNGVRFS
jgi:SRSO17 transposase